jgi:hypothetical protein
LARDAVDNIIRTPLQNKNQVVAVNFVIHDPPVGVTFLLHEIDNLRVDEIIHGKLSFLENPAFMPSFYHPRYIHGRTKSL